MSAVPSFTRTAPSLCLEDTRRAIKRLIRMLRSMLILLMALAASPAALGQTACPSGVAPGSPQCGPDSGTSRGAPPPPRPTGEWVKTWGAVAATGNGDVGVSSGYRTKSQAEQGAINSCEGLGSGKCKVSMTYFNQCVAGAADDKGGGSLFSAESIELASKLAMAQCEKNTGNRCRVTLSKCTDPIFDRY